MRDRWSFAESRLVLSCFLAAGAFLALPDASRADECGTGTAGVSRFDAYSASAHASYTLGTVIRHTISSTTRLYVATGAVTGAPTATGGTAGWSAPLGATAFAANQATCPAASVAMPGSPYDATIDYSATEGANLAIIYSRTDATQIKTEGNGAEIHLTGSAVVNQTSTTVNESAVSIVSSGTDDIRVHTASGTSITNVETHFLVGSVSTTGLGNVYLRLAGSTTSAAGYGIRARTNSTGTTAVVDVKILGGTHRAASTQGAGTAVVALSSTLANLLTLDISSGATVTTLSAANAATSATRAIYLGSTRGGASTITGNIPTAWAGNRVNNAGTVVGDFQSVGGRDLFHIQTGGSFTGKFDMGAGNDFIYNEGTMTLDSDSDFEGGTANQLTNTGILVFDHAANGDSIVDIANMDTFANLDGELRFNVDFSGALPAFGIANIGSPTAATFEGGTVNVVAEAGTRPTSGTLTLIESTTLTSIGGLRSSHGVLSITSGLVTGNNNLQIAFASFSLCNAAATTRTAMTPGAATEQVSCGAADPNGVSATRNNLALLYNAASGTTPFVRLAGHGNEIHLNNGMITKPANADNNAAVSVLDVSNTDSDVLYITTAAGTTVTNQDTDSNSGGVLAASNRGTSPVTLDVAGDVTTAGGSSHAVWGQINPTGNSSAVFITVSGDTTTTGANASAIFALTSGAGAVNIDITDGTHQVMGATSGASSGVVSASANAGAISIEVSSGATVHAAGTTSSRAVYMGGTGPGGLVNSGTIIGDIRGAGGAQVFTNNDGGEFTGSFSLGDGTDAVSNAGTLTLDDSADFGTGSSDSLSNTGTLIIDHDANGDAQIGISGLETFRQTSGTLRFVFDFSNPVPSVSATNALLDLGAATATFTAGRIELTAAPGGDVGVGTTIPLITRTGGISSIGGLTASQGTLAIDSGSGILVLQLLDTVCGDFSTRVPAPPGAATREVICSAADANAYASGIRTDEANTAILYNAAATGTPFISHTGAGGEIHIQSGTISHPDGTDGHAVSINSTAAGDLYLTTAADTTVSNLDTDGAQGGIHATLGVAAGATLGDSSNITMNIAGAVSTVGGLGSEAVLGSMINTTMRGDISITVSGNTSTTGANNSAIYGITLGTGNVDIDITGGTHTASGAQRSITNGEDGVVRITARAAGGGQTTLDISSGATVQAMGSATRAISLNSANTLTGTARTIGSGSFSGSRVSNAGTIIGDFLTLSDGNVLFENSGTFTGEIALSGGDDEIRNSGTLTLNGDANFGGGTSDLFVNTGTLVIDHAAANAQIDLDNLETFTQTGGIIRFRLNFGRAIPASAILDLESAAATFSAAAIEIEASAGTAVPSSGTILLINQVADWTADQLAAFSALQGDLSISASGKNLQIALVPNVCGKRTSARVAQSPGAADRQVVCDSAAYRAYSGGITAPSDAGAIAVIYESAAFDTPFISNPSPGGEIHILRGSITKTAGANRHAVSILASTGDEPIYISTADGTTVTNEDADSGDNAGVIAAKLAGNGAVTLDIAGDVSTVGTGSSHAIWAQINPSANSGDISVTASGDTTTSGNSASAIHAISSGSGAINVFLTGGTHTGSGAQGGDGAGIVTLSTGSAGGQLTLDISSGATVQAVGSATRALRFFSSNTATATRRTIPTGDCPDVTDATNADCNWMGNRITNAGTVVGRFTAGGNGNLLFENAATGSFAGEIAPSGGADEINNAGTMTLNGAYNFGGGIDAFVNTGTGTIVIDHAANGNMRINLQNLETFTMSSGSIRFVYDFAADVTMGNIAPGFALLTLGGATTVTFGEEVTVEVVASSAGQMGADRPGIQVPLIARGISTSDLTPLQADGISSADGLVSVVNGVIQIALRAVICGQNPDFEASGSPVVAAASRVSCASATAGAYSAGITNQDTDNLAIIYDSPASGTPSINHDTDDGGEIHILQGTITKPDGADRHAVSVLASSGSGALYITVRDDVTVTNEDSSGTNNAGVLASVNGGASPVTLDVAGDVSTAGSGNSHAVWGQINPAGNSSAISITASGDTITSGADTSAIRALTNGAGAVDISITGGTHRASGSTSGTSAGVVSGTAQAGAIMLNIASGATVTILDADGAATSAERAIYLASSNTATANRLANAGTVIGDLAFASDGVFLFENLAGASFTGAISGLGENDDAVRNAGVMRLDGNADFGATTAGSAWDVDATYARGDRFVVSSTEFIVDGTDVQIAALNALESTDSDPDTNTPGISEFAENDLFENTGILVIDHAGNANTQIDIENLETFTFTSGTLRFLYDFGTHAASTVNAANALLDLNDAAAAFTAGAIEILSPSGSASATHDMITVPLITRTSTGGLTMAQVSALINGRTDLSIVNGILQIALPATVCGDVPSTRGEEGEPIAPGAATQQVTCSASAADSYASGIATSIANLAVIYDSAATGTEFIRSESDNSEIHILQGRITKSPYVLGSGNDNFHPAVGIEGRGSALYLTTASGSSISNTGTGNGEYGIYVNYAGSGSGNVVMDIAGRTSSVGTNNHAIFAQIESSAGTGDIFLTVSGDSSATGNSASAIYASARGTGEVHVDITGGAHAASGDDGTFSPRGVVALSTLGSTPGGHITLDISAGATVRASGTKTIAVFFQANDTSTQTARTIGTGMWSGSRFTNRGTVFGAFRNPNGRALFENHGTFTGSIANAGFDQGFELYNAGVMTLNDFGATADGTFGLRAHDFTSGVDRLVNSGTLTLTNEINFGSGNDELQNSGTFTIGGDVQFSGGSDSFTNTGTLVIDHHTRDRRVFLFALETFTQTRGTLRFRLDFSGALPTVPLLDIGEAVPTFTAARIELLASAGTIPVSGVIPLITGDEIDAGLSLSPFTLGANANGTLSVVGNVLQLSLSPPRNLCGNSFVSRSVSGSGAATRQVICSSVPTGQGITAYEDRLAVLYAASARFVRHVGSGGEVHVRAGGSIVKPNDGNQGAALSVINPVDSAPLWSSASVYAAGDRFRVGDVIYQVRSDVTTQQLANLNGLFSAPTLAAARLGLVRSSELHPILITTAAGTSISNADVNAGNHGIHASGGGDITMILAGSTSARGASDAVRAETVDAKSIDIAVNGGTHTTSGAQGATSAIINLATGSGTISLTIAGGATVGSASALARRAVRLATTGGTTITNLGNLYGVVMGSAGVDSLRNSGIFRGRFDAGEGADIFTNTGEFRGRFNAGGGDDRLVNSATFTGSFDMGGGDDSVRNTGTMTLNANSDFGAHSVGGGDSFVNNGILVVDHNANGDRQISLNGLETFRQESGVISFVFDFVKFGALAQGSAGALLDIGSAVPTFNLGRIEIISADGSVAPPRGVLPLITGENLAGAGLGGLDGRTNQGALSIVGDVLQVALIPRDAAASLQTYDAVLQTGWFSDRAFARAMLSSECEPVPDPAQLAAGLIGRGLCSWMRLGARFTRHSPAARARYNEDAFALVMGFNYSQSSWRLTAAAGYDRGDLEILPYEGLLSSAEANRLHLGLGVGTSDERLPGKFDIDIQFRLGYTAYAAKHALRSGAAGIEGEADLVTLTSALGVEKRARVKILDPIGSRLFGSWLVISRTELGVMAQAMDSFSETGGDGAFTVEDIAEALPFASTYIEARGVKKLPRGGALTPWGRLRADVFLGRPESGLKASFISSDESFRATGTLEQALIEVGLGVGYESETMEINVSYEGGFALDSSTEIHNGSLRLNYKF